MALGVYMDDIANIICQLFQYFIQQLPTFMLALLFQISIIHFLYNKIIIIMISFDGRLYELIVVHPDLKEISLIKIIF